MRSRDGCVSAGRSVSGQGLVAPRWLALHFLFLLPGLTLPVLSAAELAEAARARASIRADDLRVHAELLADDRFEGREAGSRGGIAAANYLIKQLADLGLQGGGDRETNGSRQFVQWMPGGYRNLLAILPGTDPDLRREVIVVGAHYDHVGYGTQRTSFGPLGHIHNGADDNASGTAGVLEVAQAFVDLAPRRTILFALWDGEEQGLLGSKHWTAHPTVPLADVRLMINADMIGRLRDERVEVYGTRSAVGLRRLVSQQNAELGLRLDFRWEMRDDSDHYSFFNANIPILMLHTGLHDDYHRPSDDFERLDIPGMERVSQLMFQVALAAADGPEIGEFRPAARGESASTRDLVERTLPDLPPRLGLQWAPDVESHGLLIRKVAPTSAAERAGLKPGQRVVQLNGAPVVPERFGRDVLAARDDIELAVEDRSGSPPRSVRVHLDGQPARLGVSWRTDPAEPDTILVARVLPGSAAEDAGLRPRDRILAANGQSAREDTKWQALLGDTRGPLTLLVEREGRTRTVVIDLTDGTAHSS